MLDERAKTLLKALVERYIADGHANPVSIGHDTTLISYIGEVK